MFRNSGVVRGVGVGLHVYTRWSNLTVKPTIISHYQITTKQRPLPVFSPSICLMLIIVHFLASTKTILPSPHLVNCQLWCSSSSRDTTLWLRLFVLPVHIMTCSSISYSWSSWVYLPPLCLNPWRSLPVSLRRTQQFSLPFSLCSS